jgi:fatty acid synthase
MYPTFFQQIKSVQPTGPYHLAGYSFGACVAIEMTLQLQASQGDGRRVVEGLSPLVLLDGSHMFVAAHTATYRDKLTIDSEAQAETEALCAFVQQFTADVDYASVRFCDCFFLCQHI